jgi:hypothetical protein
MTDYSYTIYVDEEQLQALDNKIRELEGLSGKLDVGGVDISDKMDEILRLSGFDKEQKTTQSIDEILGGIATVEFAVRSLYRKIDDVVVDEIKIANIMEHLAKTEFAGEFMGTKQLYDAIDRLEAVTTGIRGGEYTPVQVMEDLSAIADITGTQSFDSVVNNIMADLRGKVQFENLFTGTDIKNEALDKLFGKGAEAMGKYQPLIDKQQQRRKTLDAAWKANMAEAERVSMMQTIPAPEGEKGRSRMVDPSGLYLPSAKGDPMYVELHTDPAMPGPARVAEINKMNVMITRRIQEIDKGIANLLVKAVQELGLGRGQHTMLKAGMRDVAKEIVNRIGQGVEGELDDRLTGDLMAGIIDVLTKAFKLDKSAIGYSMEDVVEILQFVTSMDWKTVEDMQRGYGAYLLQQETDPAKLAKMENMFTSTSPMSAAVMGFMQEFIRTSATIQGGVAAAGEALNVPIATVPDQASLEAGRQQVDEIVEQRGAAVPPVPGVPGADNALIGEVKEAVKEMVSVPPVPGVESKVDEMKDQLRGISEQNDTTSELMKGLLEAMGPVKEGLPSLFEELRKKKFDRA